jgi:hypothetical protein
MAPAHDAKVSRSLREGFRWSGVRVDIRLLVVLSSGFLADVTAPPFRALLDSLSHEGSARRVAF